MILDEILVSRRYVISKKGEGLSDIKKAYYNGYLYDNYGITLDKPELITEAIVKTISDFLCLNIPASFYNNPQDLNFFKSDELFIEKLISYFMIEISGVKNENTNFLRPQIFAKKLPDYKDGSEVNARLFVVLTEEEAKLKLKEIYLNYCAYKRPFSLDEKDEFITLIVNDFYENEKIMCKINNFLLILKYPEIAKKLDYKDVVNYSVGTFTNAEALKSRVKLNDNEPLDEIIILKELFNNAHSCPLSRKQAKYYNKIAKTLGSKKRVNNDFSPYKKAIAALKMNDLMLCAKEFSKSGSLLERNIKMLLARANSDMALELIEMLPNKNPIALYQFYLGLLDDDGIKPRIFTFIKKNRVHMHLETEYEVKYRKSRISDDKRRFLLSSLKEKILSSYQAMPKWEGKIYLSKEFNKIAIPVNTSATGKGLDVLPTGSRLKITKDYLRTFVYWKDIFDIDSSLILEDSEGFLHTFGFWNYDRKEFGPSCLSSGDCRDENGAEFYDIKISELIDLGFVNIVQVFNGYQQNLNSDHIYAGFQYKDNLNTKAWSAKNIEMQMHIKGDTRSAVSFGIDLISKEVIIFNLMRNSDSSVLEANDYLLIKKYFNPNFLSINMASIIKKLGQITDNIDEANIVFDRDYIPKDGVEVVRPYDIEKLVKIASTGTLK